MLQGQACAPLKEWNTTPQKCGRKVTSGNKGVIGWLVRHRIRTLHHAKPIRGTGRIHILHGTFHTGKVVTSGDRVLSSRIGGTNRKKSIIIVYRNFNQDGLRDVGLDDPCETMDMWFWVTE